MFNGNTDFDLIVAGGGPAGATLATLVAMQNHSVLLLERETFPRYQIGESLLPATIHGICRMLGVSEQIEKAGFPLKRGGTFSWGTNKEPWTFSFDAAPIMGKTKGYAYQVERSRFDKMLLDNARHKGVHVVENCTALEVIERNNRICGLTYSDDRGQTQTATAAFVADATGSHSKLAPKVGEKEYSKFFQNIALFGYYEGGKRLPPPNDGNMLVASFTEGWFWYIPLSPTLTSVGAVISKEHIEKLRGGHEAAMDYFIQCCPLIREYLANARRVTSGTYGQLRVRKDYSYCYTNFWRPGMVVIGDAACFVDPIFSSGVHLGTYAALMAARSINTVLSSELPEDRCLVEFERRYRREFGNFYQFLIAFYDTNKNESSYFWTARKILNTDERSNEAFIRLVAGVSSSSGSVAEEFFNANEALGSIFSTQDIYMSETYNDARSRQQSIPAFSMSAFVSEMAQIQRQADTGKNKVAESPLFERGLVPTADGFRWEEKIS